MELLHRDVASPNMYTCVFPVPSLHDYLSKIQEYIEINLIQSLEKSLIRSLIVDSATSEFLRWAEAHANCLIITYSASLLT